jgi:hypothetical protein
MTRPTQQAEQQSKPLTALLSALALLLPLCSATASASKPDAVPDWVRTAAQQKLPQYPPETNAVVLLEDTTYTVAPDGSATEHFRSVVKILRPQGRGEGVIGVPFDKDTKILSMHVWSIGPDGHEYAVKDNEMIEAGYPNEGSLFMDLKIREANAPARDPGGIVAYEYEQRTHPYLTEKTWFFQSGLPRLSQSFTLELPPGFTYGTVWAHSKEAPPADLEHQRWRWERNNVPATSRDKNIFLKQYLSLSQLDDDLAIVTLGGKEIALDPGSRYCPYGHLAWKHTMAGGIRQNDHGGDLFSTPSASPTESRTQRVGNLKLDSDGTVTGTIKITYIGAPALRWRQSALEGDTTSFEHELRTSAEHQLPQDLDVKITSIEKVENYDEPLVVNLDVKGHIGSSTGRRLFIPSDLFQVNVKPDFPNEKRETPIYFNYPHYNQDAIRITFPATMRIESLPATDRAEMPKLAVYVMKTESTPTSFTIRRDYLLGEVIFMKDEYPQLRTLYSKMETKDQENVVLTNAPAPAKPAGN